jgi:hypothetical protein
MCLCLALYALRMYAYAALPSATYFVPVELLHGVTFSIFYAASVVHCGAIAPPGTAATMQGVLLGCAGVGSAAGALGGGMVAARAGLGAMFFWFSVGAAACAPPAWLLERWLASRARRAPRLLWDWMEPSTSTEPLRCGGIQGSHPHASEST